MDVAKYDKVTRALLRCGIAAGPLYLTIGFAQAILRDGFDVRRHALSVLGNGPLGWIQVANFLVAGLLVLAGAVGMRRLLAGGRAGTWGPILLAVYGIGLIGAGIFVADPAPGFPPGVSPPAQMSRSGLLHFVFGGVGFYGLIGACFVFARRFFGRRQTARGAFSVLTGIVFFASFAAIASGATSPAVMLAFYAAVTWIWIWHALTHGWLLRDAAAAGQRGDPSTARTTVAGDV